MKPPYTVAVLVTIPDAASFDACTLCFDTLRVGFPNAKLDVYLNWTHDQVLRQKFYDKLDKLGISCTTFADVHHLADWERARVMGAVDPLVLVDPDTIFWKSCEEMEFPERTLLAGYYVPRMWNDFARCISLPRIHTSFMVFPNPAGLRSAILNAYTPAHETHGEYCPCDPFKPTVQVIGGIPFYWDCCANLYGMLPPHQVWHFTKEALACYDHLNSASFFDVMLDRLHGDKEAFAYIHRFAPTAPARGVLKNLWPNVNAYYAERAASANRRLSSHGPVL